MTEDNKTKQNEASTKVKKSIKKKTDFTGVVKPGLEEKKSTKRRRRRRKPAKKLNEVKAEASTGIPTDQASKGDVASGSFDTVHSEPVTSGFPISEPAREEAFSTPTPEETDFAFQDEEISTDESMIEPAVEAVTEFASEPLVEPEKPEFEQKPETKEFTPFESWGPVQEKPIAEPEQTIVEPQPFVSETEQPQYTAPVQPFFAPQEPSFVSPEPSVPSNIKEPVGWEDTNGFSDIGGVNGVAKAATEAKVVETPDWFAPSPEEVKESEPIVESEPIMESEPIAKSEPEVTPKWEPEPQTSTVQDVTSEVDSVEEGSFGKSSSEEKSSFMNLLAEAGIKKKHLFMVGGVLFTIFLAILIAIFSYGPGTSGVEKAVEQVKKTEEVQEEKETKEEVKEEVNKEVNKEASVETGTEVVATDDFQISGLINSYIFGLEFTQNRVLPMLDTTPISDEGTLVGIDSSLAAGQSLQFKQETIAQSLDLLLKIENARKLDIYDYLNRTTDRVAALNEHIRDLQVLLTTAEAQKNVIVAQMTTLNTEYAQITAQKSSYEKAFFTSVNSYYGNDSYNNLTLFTEASQLQVKVKANYNALSTLNAMYNTSIKVLTPRINDIVLNFDALVEGVQVTEVKNSNINAIKF